MKNCSWFWNASSFKQYSLFKIKKFCVTQSRTVRETIYARWQGISDIVAIIVLDKFLDVKKIYTPWDIVQDMIQLHEVSFTYLQAWRSKTNNDVAWRSDRIVLKNSELLINFEEILTQYCD